MNLVLDNTVEVNGTERTDIGMVQPQLAFPQFGLLRQTGSSWSRDRTSEGSCRASLWEDPQKASQTATTHACAAMPQVIRGNSVVMIEALESVR
eukprot:SM000017S02929  [mRNA]  locus=s17:1094394:1094692:- [translate_table: standard]